MFGIGAIEFFLIALVALLVIGPQQMPRALYAAGKALRRMRRFSADLQAGFDKITEEMEIEEIVREANKAGDELTEFRTEQQKALEARKQKKNAKPAKSKKSTKSTKAAKTAKKKSVPKKSAAKKADGRKTGRGKK